MNHKEFTVNFGTRLNFLVGHNGSKSDLQSLIPQKPANGKVENQPVSQLSP